MVNKTDGKEIERVRVVISKNGRSSTVTSKAKNEKGPDFLSVTVYDKQ